MPRFSSLFTPIRKSLLDRATSALIDPFQPLANPGRPLRLKAPVGLANLAAARNRPDDVLRLATSLADAGLPKAKRPSRPTNVFDSPLETAVCSFQRRNKLKVDGLLTPKGPTNQAINRSIALLQSKRTPAPPLRNLSGAAFAANARLVRAMMGSTEDGILPDLMASDFRANKAGQAKTADFLSQLFARDPERAKVVRAKARGFMTEDETSLLDRLTLQARKADAEALAKAQPPGDPDDDEPDDPEPEDPDEPDEPDEPEDPPKKPEPNCEAEEETVDAAKEDLENAESHLETTQNEVTKTESDIPRTEGEIEKIEGEIQEGKDAIAETERLIKDADFNAQYSFDKLHRIISRKKSISLRNDLEKQKGILEQVHEEMKALRAELETLKEILPELRKAVEEAKESIEQAQAALEEAKEILEECKNRDG